jgi:hypothetical protein
MAILWTWGYICSLRAVQLPYASERLRTIAAQEIDEVVMKKRPGLTTGTARPGRPKLLSCPIAEALTHLTLLVLS